MLEIKGLKVRYGANEVVRGVDLAIKKGECVGLVGESGCGKTTVGLATTKLIDARKGGITSGRIFFEDRDVLGLDAEDLRKIRGRRISYVFQEPSSSLNPVFTVHEQLREALPEKDRAEKAISRILADVGLEKIVGKKQVYPHELSGGMQQRVMIAMAVAPEPDLLILDEPTTALDVSVQKQILELIAELKEKMRLSILFISHDLRIVFSMADRIEVMYAGRIVESGLKKDIVSEPRHPYTKGLINSIPSMKNRKKKFEAIEGKAPLFSDLPQGCKFHPRCGFRIEKCMEKEPALENVSDSHFARCVRAKELL
ncbi:MAG: ABC transporter ATP-binding protein [Candidatus Omnitrophica bacterium]|nr:ABC transporter ATP-binding protein [Candidatus Omnitrophota bacterium]